MKNQERAFELKSMFVDAIRWDGIIDVLDCFCDGLLAARIDEQATDVDVMAHYLLWDALQKIKEVAAMTMD